MISMNPATWTDSALRRDTPRNAISQHMATPSASTRSKAPAAPATPPWNRNPSPTATPTMISDDHAVRTMSAVTRPATTAERAIGSDRNRSMRPLWKSAFNPTAVCVVPNPIPCTSRPGSTNCR